MADPPEDKTKVDQYLNEAYGLCRRSADEPQDRHEHNQAGRRIG